MRLDDFLLHLHLAKQRYGLTGEEQVMIADTCHERDPESGADLQPISAVSMLEFRDGEKCVFLINTTRAEAMAIREGILRREPTKGNPDAN